MAKRFVVNSCSEGEKQMSIPVYNKPLIKVEVMGLCALVCHKKFNLAKDLLCLKKKSEYGQSFKITVAVNTVVEDRIMRQQNTNFTVPYHTV